MESMTAYIVRSSIYAIVIHGGGRIKLLPLNVNLPYESRRPTQSSIPDSPQRPLLALRVQRLAPGYPTMNKLRLAPTPTPYSIHCTVT